MTSPPSNSFLPVESDRELAGLFTRRHRRFLEEKHPAWGANQARSLERQRVKGALSTSLWKPTGGRAIGMVWLQTLSTSVRLHGVWLEPAGPEFLEALMEDLGRDAAGPIGVVTDVLPGMSDEEQLRFFRRRGFWHRAKVLMRRDPQRSSAAAPQASKVRPIQLADLEPIVGIYVRAYSRRPGEFWTWGFTDAWAEARDDVMGHVDRAGGWAADFLPKASFVWEDAGRVLGAVLVDAARYSCPYVEDLIVEPEFHRQGIGRSLLETTIRELTGERPQAIELGAIRAGAPYRLYQKLGFEELPPPRGRLDGNWVRGESPF